MFLDTTFVIDLLGDNPGTIEKLDELVATASPVALSTLTVFEVGVGLGPGERFERIADSEIVVPLSWSESRRAVEVHRTLRDTGEGIGVIDSLIAGTAIEFGESRVLTRNVDAFACVAAITVETY